MLGPTGLGKRSGARSGSRRHPTESIEFELARRHGRAISCTDGFEELLRVFVQMGYPFPARSLSFSGIDAYIPARVMGKPEPRPRPVHPPAVELRGARPAHGHDLCEGRRAEEGPLPDRK